MELDAIRFSIGPWNGRYSSVWRIWSNPGSDDVYLGVRSILKYLKISLHKSGKFRAAFTDSYNQKMVEGGREAVTDRAFLKWDKKPVSDNEIIQALEIHFPLSALSLEDKPEAKKGKEVFLLAPHEGSLRDNDSVTLKILFHKTHPESKAFKYALKQKNVMPFLNMELSTEEFVSVCCQYTKQLPLKITEEEINKYAAMFHEYFIRREKQVGDKVDDLTIQIFQMGLPPTVHNIGCVSVHWESERNFSINVGK